MECYKRTMKMGRRIRRRGRSFRCLPAYSCDLRRERPQAESADHGVQAGIARIKRIRKKPGLRSKQKRRFNCRSAPNIFGGGLGRIANIATFHCVQ